ncbi:3-oxoadipate enol-lactonase [Gordonia pseudamarae]|jgi:3-oxoadipate enol-lactonase|uniref:3-oxoadipate enol-lactonase n=1 Tax=Gordonia pseudamarae TaxID=2831662 RepID=A0ABX6IF81_9ACTN|nr:MULTISPECIES: 3-oxoadipate enol-lactonase [Gordonia]MBD0022284.1 3-oxoadipate enol-lactonase [Gordonia sp. (in: high G+C Gram-positive bacteria)]QHN24990.1 3-oxoadipate enol-lactonase [Gordonia pseudamarae]QHN33925.1 3-oxoadipate enol-lactonase [Gordonia pseudamarae]
MSAVTVDAVVTGHPDGPTVVLSNSLGSDRRMWDAQLPELEKHFRVVRYDTRGHGRSPVPDGAATIDDLADDLIALLDRLDIASCHLVGLSLGGMTAMRVAMRVPARVDRMVLLCTGAQLPPRSGWIERAALVREHGTSAVAESVVGRWFTPSYLESEPDRRRFYEAMVAATPSAGYAACCEAIADLDLREGLSSITAPTLSIAGADDVATPPAKLEEIVSAIPDARLLVVPESAHLANAQQPQIITPAIIDHLEGSDG